MAVYYENNDAGVVRLIEQMQARESAWRSLLADASDLLTRIRDEHLDNYADVNDGEGGPVANTAMRLMADVDRLLLRLTRVVG